MLGLLVLGAAVASAKPGTPPPDVKGTTYEPPPAWASAQGGDGWLAYGSFCWQTACVDFIPPSRRTDVPKLRAQAGVTIGIHLRFVPKSVRVRVLETGRSYSLVAARDTHWRVRGSGLIVVEARGAAGSASYVARIVR